MIITDDFVFLNFPKTGSTFVRQVFKRIHKSNPSQTIAKNGFRIYQAPNIRALGRQADSVDEHGLRIQIPETHQDKPIYSVRRNIYEQLVSLYEYGHWRISHQSLESAIMCKYPHYPNLSFAEFVKVRYDYPVFKSHPWIVNFPAELGPSSIANILFYARDPFYLINNWGAAAKEVFLKEMQDINFLETHSLNEDLVDILLKHNYPEHTISFIKDKEKVNTSKPLGRTYDSYYTNEIRDIVKSTEPLL